MAIAQHKDLTGANLHDGVRVVNTGKVLKSRTIDINPIDVAAWNIDGTGGVSYIVDLGTGTSKIRGVNVLLTETYGEGWQIPPSFSRTDTTGINASGYLYNYRTNGANLALYLSNYASGNFDGGSASITVTYEE